MFIHNLDPCILPNCLFNIRWYGLVYVIGFLLAYYVLNKNKKELGLKKDDVETFFLYLMIFGIVGARLFATFIWNPNYYFANPLDIFALWKGGMSFHGGVLGASIAAYYFAKKNNINFGKLADILVIPAIFGLALGRIANFINGELVGNITNVSWCVNFPNYEGCRHPVQLYGAAGRFLLLGYLMVLKQIKKYKEGFLFWNFILIIGLGRFFTDFLRTDTLFLGLSLGQYLSLIMIGVGWYVLFKYYRKNI